MYGIGLALFLKDRYQMVVPPVQGCLSQSLGYPVWNIYYGDLAIGKAKVTAVEMAT